MSLFRRAHLKTDVIQITVSVLIEHGHRCDRIGCVKSDCMFDPLPYVGAAY